MRQSALYGALETMRLNGSGYLLGDRMYKNVDYDFVPGHDGLFCLPVVAATSQNRMRINNSKP